MGTNDTQYKVVERGCVTVRKGNLRQCWLYVLNTYPEATAGMLADLGLTIEPANKKV